MLKGNKVISRQRVTNRTRQLLLMIQLIQIYNPVHNTKYRVEVYCKAEIIYLGSKLWRHILEQMLLCKLILIKT